MILNPLTAAATKPKKAISSELHLPLPAARDRPSGPGRLGLLDPLFAREPVHFCRVDP